MLFWGSSEKSLLRGTDPLSALSPCRTAALWKSREWSAQCAPHTSGRLARALTSSVSGHSGCSQHNEKSAKRAGWGCLRAAQAHRSGGAAVAAVPPALPPALPRPPACLRTYGTGATRLQSRAAELLETSKNMNVGIPRDGAGGQQAADRQRHPAPGTPRPHRTAALGFKQHTLHPAMFKTPFTAEAMQHMLLYVNNASKQSHNNYSVHTEQQTLIKLNRKQCSEEKHAKGLMPLVVTATWNKSCA